MTLPWATRSFFALGVDTGCLFPFVVHMIKRRFLYKEKTWRDPFLATQGLRVRECMGHHM